MSFVPLVRLWIWVSVFASAAGWTLSALGQLNRAGYGIALAVFIFLMWVARREWSVMPGGKNGGWAKIRRRFCRPLPLCFAALAALILLGGVLYPPTSYTGLNYREARVLQWLSHDHWLWIHTANYRMNDRACGIEWLTAPLLLFTKSDRALFLVNFLPFLLLPGLVYSVFTRLGVRARVAWQWMWLLPTGYNFLLQAGGISNDTFPAVYALAAVDFAARAWSSRRTADVWYSIMAAALLTGAKASNLPLLLPWAILIFALLPLMRRKPVASVVLVLLATRKFGRVAIGKSCQANNPQRANRRGCNELWRGARDLEGEGNVFTNGSSRQEAEILEDDADPTTELWHVTAREAMDRKACDIHLTCGWTHVANKEPNQRGFSCA